MENNNRPHRAYMGIFFLLICLFGACSQKVSSNESAKEPNPASIDSNSSDKSKYSIIVSKSVDELLFKNGYESLAGFAIVEGYYTKIIHKNDANSEFTVDGFKLVKAPIEFNRYYQGLIESGNTLNQKTPDGQLIIGIDLKTSLVPQAMILNSTINTPVRIILKISPSDDGEGYSFFAIAGLLR